VCKLTIPLDFDLWLPTDRWPRVTAALAEASFPDLNVTPSATGVVVSVAVDENEPIINALDAIGTRIALALIHGGGVEHADAGAMVRLGSARVQVELAHTLVETSSVTVG
jgi:hypothetical protein